MIKINFVKYRLFVLLMKVAIVIAVLGSLLSIILPFFYRYTTKIVQNNDAIKALSNYEYESYAVEPKFYGLDNKNQEYHIQAESGYQKSQSEISLEQVKARYILENSATIYLSSKTGAIDIENNKMETQGDNKLVYDNKYSLSADKFLLNYKDSLGYGKSGVLLESKMGQISSEEVEIKDNYQTIRFFGNRVKTVLFVEDANEQK